MKRIGTFGQALEYARRQAAALATPHYIQEIGADCWVSSEKPARFNSLGRWSGAWTVLEDGRYCCGEPVTA